MDGFNSIYIWLHAVFKRVLVLNSLSVVLDQ